MSGGDGQLRAPSARSVRTGGSMLRARGRTRQSGRPVMRREMSLKMMAIVTGPRVIAGPAKAIQTGAVATDEVRLAGDGAESGRHSSGMA